MLLQVTCVINIENWSKWLLDDPVYYIKYGAFRPSESSEFFLIKQTNVSCVPWEREVFFYFSYKSESRRRVFISTKSQWYKGVTSHFYFLLFHNIFVSTFPFPQYICFHFSFSTIYLFPLFSVPRARSVPQPPRSCCCGKWWRWQVPVYHCFFATILFCIKPMVMTGD